MGEKSRGSAGSGDELQRGAGGAPISPDVSLENPGVTEQDVAEREAKEGVQVQTTTSSRTQADREATHSTVTVPNPDDGDTAGEGKGSNAAHK